MGIDFFGVAVMIKVARSIIKLLRAGSRTSLSRSQALQGTAYGAVTNLSAFLKSHE